MAGETFSTYAPYARLGMAVITQAIRDLSNKNKKIRDEAREWMQTMDDDAQGTLGWYLDGISSLGVSLPNREQFKKLMESKDV